jgi:hypothetical protein
MEFNKKDPDYFFYQTQISVFSEICRPYIILYRISVFSTDMFRCATFAQIGITFARIKIKSIIAWYDRSITSKMYL